ncbi:WAS/WASL-interacting protein family member 1-like [Chamaea fasciata]|uniref:WAS/WASL-interacting protein family member 1-like n=1 Tax=Chamaea fasciata TaxID=190680 RepID=UPI00336A8F2C
MRPQRQRRAPNQFQPIQKRLADLGSAQRREKLSASLQPPQPPAGAVPRVLVPHLPALGLRARTASPIHCFIFPGPPGEQRPAGGRTPRRRRAGVPAGTRGERGRLRGRRGRAGGTALSPRPEALGRGREGSGPRPLRRDEPPLGERRGLRGARAPPPPRPSPGSHRVGAPPPLCSREEPPPPPPAPPVPLPPRQRLDSRALPAPPRRGR